MISAWFNRLTLAEWLLVLAIGLVVFATAMQIYGSIDARQVQARSQEGHLLPPCSGK